MTTEKKPKIKLPDLDEEAPVEDRIRRLGTLLREEKDSKTQDAILNKIQSLTGCAYCVETKVYEEAPLRSSEEGENPDGIEDDDREDYLYYWNWNNPD